MKNAMKKSITFVAVFAAVAIVAACTSTGPGGGSGSDGGADSAVDGGTDSATGSDSSSCSGSMQTGTALCQQVLGALCSRRVSCCTSANPPVCGTSDTLNHCNCLGIGGGTCLQSSSQGCSGTYCGSTCAQSDCMMWMTHDPKGYDCSQSKFVTKTACSDLAKSCTDALPLIACTDFTGGTANWPAACQSFWASF